MLNHTTSHFGSILILLTTLGIPRVRGIFFSKITASKTQKQKLAGVFDDLYILTHFITWWVTGMVQAHTLYFTCSVVRLWK